MKKLLIAIGFVMAASAARASTYIPVLMSTATNPAVQAGSANYSFHVASGTVDHFTAPSVTAGTMTANGFTVTSGTFTWVGASTVAVNGNTIVATAGTRTWTLPDLGGNYSVVGSSGSQTLSNKTFDNATLSNALNANSQKIVNITSGTVNSDAARYSQTKLLQEVAFTVTSSSSTTGSSFVTTNLSGSITPSNAASKVRIHTCFPATTSNIGFTCDFTIAKNGSNLGSATGMVTYGGASAGTNSIGFPVCMEYVDSPSTTSSTTYAVQVKNESGGITCSVGSGSTTQVLILDEINGL